ncbi:MAG: hypothetical protein WA354_16205 [Terracidiphilus sp.]
MSSASGIEIQSQALIPGKATVTLLAAVGTASSSTQKNPTPTHDAASFRQSWQTVLDTLRAFEEITGKDAPPESEGLVTDATSGPAFATGIHGANDGDVRRMSEPALRTTHWSDSTRVSPRKTLHVLPFRGIALGPDANQPLPTIEAHDSSHASQGWPSSNKKPARIETTPNFIAKGIVTNPNFPPTPAIVPPEALSLQASKPAAPPAYAEVGDSTASPSGKHEGERVASAFAAPNGYRSTPVTAQEDGPASDPLAAASPSQHGVERTSAGTTDADDILSGHLGNENTRALHLTSSSQSLQSNSIGPSAPGTVSLPSMQTYDRIAPVDTSIEQEGHPDAPGAAAMRVRQPVSPLRNHMSMREAVPGFRSKLDAEPSATHVAVSPPGMQPLCDARAGQFAGIPAANIAQIPENELGIAANEHPALAREPFMAIDSGGDDTSAKWVLAGGHRAEAGFQDSSLGWVSVRAQAGAEGIHAAVVPSSDVAAQVLGSHLAGLNAHLASHYEHLNPVTLSAANGAWDNRESGQEMAQGNHRDTSHGRQQQQMREDPAPNRIEAVASSARGFAERQLSSVPMRTLTIAPNPIDGHISFIA